MEAARISRSWCGVEDKERKVSIYCKLHATLGRRGKIFQIGLAVAQKGLFALFALPQQPEINLKNQRSITNYRYY